MKLAKVTGKFLLASGKTSNRSFDKLDGANDSVTEAATRAFLNAYKAVLATGSSVVSGKFIIYEETEVSFD